MRQLQSLLSCSCDRQCPQPGGVHDRNHDQGIERNRPSRSGKAFLRGPGFSGALSDLPGQRGTKGSTFQALETAETKVRQEKGGLFIGQNGDQGKVGVACPPTWAEGTPAGVPGLG